MGYHYFGPQRGVVRVEGEDAQKLLHDTLTCRFDESLEGVGRWFALLSPQGKVLIDGLVTLADGVYWFEMHASLVPEFLRMMRRYRLRAKVEIEHEEDLAVLWSPDGTVPKQLKYASYRDERSPNMGVRHIVRWDASVPNDETVTLFDYEMARVSAGLPEWGADFQSNEAFPHDLGMDLCNGVDFKKGCYVGQEVVSRMQHRGTARRRPVIVSGTMAASGTPLLVDGREVGDLGPTFHDPRTLSIARIDRIEDPAAATVEGKPVMLTLPPWANYKFGESPRDG